MHPAACRKMRFSHMSAEFNVPREFSNGVYNDCMKELLRALRKHYSAHRLNLPWRKTRDPYKILVSEVMLQQTQVERVIPYYEAFVEKFPTARELAAAPLRQVLSTWQGLGYNRRAKFLREAAKLVSKSGFPRAVGEIEKLPAVGYYTARAIAVFAWNYPELFVETNIRTVFLYHCFPNRRKVADKEILVLVAEAMVLSKMEPRDFYAVLMDYGASLKKEGIKLNSKSRHYAPQSKFEGSARQLRGAILRELLKHHATLSVLAHKIPRNQQELAHELARLTAEGLVALRGRYFSIS